MDAAVEHPAARTVRRWRMRRIAILGGSGASLVVVGLWITSCFWSATLGIPGANLRVYFEYGAVTLYWGAFPLIGSQKPPDPESYINRLSDIEAQFRKFGLS